MNPKYLAYVCPKCKTFLALETTKIKSKCTHVIGVLPNGKPIKCYETLPSQKERDIMEKEQFHVFGLF
jgi:hypothetical protein